MGPTNLDELEDRVLDAIYRIGACLMEWKSEDWNYAPRSRYVLDHHHLCERLKEHI